jgi:2-hydroxy-3-keto-5-methylthiopentenyl-1-phosphate phosphatase
LVLSAGTRYYIEKALHGKGIEEPWIIANPGFYGNGGVVMTADTDSPFYSETYGIDKSLVVKKYKQQYHKVFYAGDSEPDFKAALLADVAFARGQLARLLEIQGHPFIPFTSFQEIAAYLERTGVLSR